jgi:tripartite-type tricarboxylate transporter receptor subunit TctC
MPIVRRIFGALSLCMLAASPVFAQTYPSKTVRIVVSNTAGGTTDILTRIIAQQLTLKLKQSFFVDDRPGAGGNIGVDIVARSPADGYTLLVSSTGPIAVNPTLYRKLSSNPITELTAVAPIASVPGVLVVNPSIPVKTLPEFMAYAKANPGKLYYGSTGVGNSGHLSGVMLQKRAGVPMTHVPYKGADSVNDLLAGRLQFSVVTVPAVVGHIRAGTLRALAVSSDKRISVLPEVPTTGESGMPNLLVGSWYGLFAPKGTPAAIVSQINKAVEEILRMPEVRAKLSQQGAEPDMASPEQYTAFVMAEYQRYKPIITESGASVE